MPRKKRVISKRPLTEQEIKDLETLFDRMQPELEKMLKELDSIDRLKEFEELDKALAEFKTQDLDFNMPELDMELDKLKELNLDSLEIPNPADLDSLELPNPAELDLNFSLDDAAENMS